MAGMASTTPRQEALSGVREMAPVWLGAIPFGLIAGVTAVGVGLPATEAVLMSAIVFAGAAQLAGLQLLQQGAPLFVILLTTLVINTRMTMYSAALAPFFRSLSPAWKALCAYLTTDQAFALGISRFVRDPKRPHKGWYYLGAGGSLWLVWMAATAVGVGLGAQLPPGLSLDFAVPLVFLALLVPAVRGRGTLIAACVGGGVAVLAAGLPLNLGLLLGAVSGIVAGAMADKREGV